MLFNILSVIKLKFFDFGKVKNSAYLKTMLNPYLSHVTEKILIQKKNEKYMIGISLTL